MSTPTKVLVRGGGDLASGIARRLHLSGMFVAILESPYPTAIRRTVSFATAVHEGEVEVEGVMGRRCDACPECPQAFIPVIVDETGATVRSWHPDVLVDARMLKRPAGESNISLARLVIGVGPGFQAGADCHAVIETQRGHDLGRVIWKGSAQEDTSIPEQVCGYGAERVLRAPASGTFVPLVTIGEHVEYGALVAEVSGSKICASISGVVRGMLHPGTVVDAGRKVGDIDPRDRREYCFTVSDKANAVAGGVMEAIFRHLKGRNS
ncbi:MAG: selenium-dependent molybdenum cofactor biosynthesis protein YqeB [Acidobacteriota bacterium]